MTLTKAREILKLHLQTSPHFHDSDLRAAHQLAIEAILFIELSRITTPGSVPTLLHEETQQ